jgi:hypothetical protein
MPVPVELLRFFDRVASATGQARHAATGIDEVPPPTAVPEAPGAPALATAHSLAAAPARHVPAGSQPPPPAGLFQAARLA